MDPSRDMFSAASWALSASPSLQEYHNGWALSLLFEGGSSNHLGSLSREDGCQSSPFCAHTILHTHPSILHTHFSILHTVTSIMSCPSYTQTCKPTKKSTGAKTKDGKYKSHYKYIRYGVEHPELREF